MELPRAGNGRYYLALTTAAASWGVATVISKQAVSEIPPFALLPIQLATSLTLLGILVRAIGQRRSWTPERTRLALLGFLNPGLSYALGLIGLTHITASLSVVLWATEPVMILVLAAWVLRESITTPIAVAASVATIGVFLAAVESDTTGNFLGIAFTLAGVAACAMYTVITRKWMNDDSTLTVIAAQQVCAFIFALIVLAIFLMTGEPVAIASWSSGAWVSAVASGLLYYALAFWLYLTGLRRIPAALAGLFLNLIPVFGVGTGYLIGERLSSFQSLGSVLIVSAVGAMLWVRSRRVLLTKLVPSIIVDNR